MTDLSDELLEDVAEVVAEFAKAMTVTIDTEDYDATTGQTKVTGTDTYQATGTSPGDPSSRMFREGETILKEGFSTVFAAKGLAFTPVVGMRVAFDGKTHRAEVVRPIYGGGEKVVGYEVVLE